MVSVLPVGGGESDQQERNREFLPRPPEAGRGVTLLAHGGGQAAGLPQAGQLLQCSGHWWALRKFPSEEIQFLRIDFEYQRQVSMSIVISVSPSTTTFYQWKAELLMCDIYDFVDSYQELLACMSLIFIWRYNAAALPGCRSYWRSLLPPKRQNLDDQVLLHRRVAS